MDSHEIAAKERAEKFVGRIELRQQIYNHCTSENVEDNTMVVNGWMGNGKTSLMAYVASKCLEHLRPGGDFVFLHIVDSCLGSNILLNMLQRLHQNLSFHIGEDDPLTTPADLKSLHATELEEIAMDYPDMKFIIIVDAVNQFSSKMDAHSMWWLPSRKAPMNLRVIISTLWDTGDTFENALKRCPKAVQVEVPDEMLEEDCKEMVLAILKRHNMEITTENKDPMVGNQMEKLLNKNRGPLYLNAAIEGMRTKWIMAVNCPLSEAHTIYIENLPLTTEELFEKLLDSWAGDFGWELIRWLMMIIAISRDGVKKSMLADLLAFVENKYSRITFKHPLESVLNFIRGFLSSETHDNVRFFHEELSQVVLEKYGKGNYEPEVRNILIQFFLKHIKEHTSEEFEKYVPYYADCLSEVVFHQTQIRMFAQDWNRVVPQVSTYGDTLKNIFFIKEKVTWNQQGELLNDFRDTTCIRMEEEEVTSLSEWERFTHFHWPYIKEYPQWSYALAVNRPNNNAVAMETRALPSDLSGGVETFPLTWLNKPDTTDQSGNVLRFVGEVCWSCCVSTADHKLVAYGCNQKALICDQSTGDIVQQIKVLGSAHTVHFSPTGAALWVGNNHGKITVWNTQTGEQEHDHLVVGQGHVTMIDHINDTTVVCGTGTFKNQFAINSIGTISLIDTVTYTITKSWSTQLPCASYCYHADEDVILSGHNKVIICWNVKDGSEVKRFKVSDDRKFKLPVRDMCAHKYRPVIAFVMETQLSGEIKTLNITTGECVTIVAECGRYIAQFDHTGENIICTNVNYRTIQIYDMSSVPLNTIRIHGGKMYNLSSLPHPCSFVSAGADGGKLHIAPTTPVVESTTQVVTWCELLPNNKEFVTLSEDGEVSVYDVNSFQLRASVVVKFSTVGWRAAVHPSGEFMMVCTWWEMCVIDLYNVEIVSVCRPPEYLYTTIRCVQFTPSGDKCLILTADHGTHVYKVHSMYTFEHLLTFTVMKDIMEWCDVTERKCVSGGEEGIVLWDIDSGETLKVLRTGHFYRFVRFLNHQPRGRILYHVWERAHDGKKDEICIMDMDGRDVKRLNTKVDGADPKLHIFDNQVITAESDGSLRLHNFHTGEMLYVFVDERSLGFTAFFDNPVTRTITCYNGNGKSYIFEKTSL